MDREIADLHAAGHGWSVRDSEPAFSEETGEIVGFVDVEQEQTQPLTRNEYNAAVRRFAPLAMLAELLVRSRHTVADWYELLLMFAKLLRNELDVNPMPLRALYAQQAAAESVAYKYARGAKRERHAANLAYLQDRLADMPGDTVADSDMARILERVYATIRSEDEGNAGNQWFLHDSLGTEVVGVYRSKGSSEMVTTPRWREGIVEDEGTQSDKLGRLNQEVPDTYDRSEIAAERAAINLYERKPVKDDEGNIIGYRGVDYGVEHAVYLRRLSKRWGDLYLHLCDWLGKQSDMGKVRKARVIWAKAYADGVARAKPHPKRVHCPHHLWLPRDLWEMLDTNCAIILGNDGRKAPWRKMLHKRIERFLASMERR